VSANVLVSPAVQGQSLCELTATVRRSAVRDVSVSYGDTPESDICRKGITEAFQGSHIEPTVL
jgi:hypothetical protein